MPADAEPAPPVVAGSSASFAVTEGDDATGVLILCDHATNIVPAPYGDLGLPPGELERHIGYDIGALAVTQALAARLGAPAVTSRFSRLLIDPNRGEDDPTLIMRLSDGAVVPGNRTVDAAERERRLNRFYRPYHAAIAARLAAMRQKGIVPLIVSMHSYTPVWRGVARRWHAGILWDRDPRAAVPMIAGLRADPALVVGDNEPYDGALHGDTLYRHATSAGLPHVLVEVRQDLIADGPGAEAWATRLAPIVTAIRGLPEVGEIARFGSRSDRPHRA